ncbi:MAG: tRNA (adenosine(37)-N6)-threonylcarbamoyltransferase complex transferase subunit TsaD [Coriobacteriia bacterium]
MARIRTLNHDDLERVVAIETAAFPEPWARTMFEVELTRDDRIWLAAEHEGELLGYAGALSVGDEAHVMNLAVRPDVRGHGIGMALLSALFEALVGRGTRRVTLEVREHNDSAISLYESAGLHDVGVRPGYYGAGSEAAVIMWTDDLESPGAAARRDVMRRSAAAALVRFGKPPGAEVILAIETSCDETAAAVMRGGTELLASVVASQIDFHARFGGVVPEIASRKHTEAIVAVVDEALGEAGSTLGLNGPLGFSGIDAIAVTYGPGLVGALVVGLAYAKGLSMAAGLPLIGVNHLEGHIMINAFDDPEVVPPLVALVVSGGHTSLVHVPRWGEYHTLGETLDDAAGEAFDKVAKVLGLGYPGGPVISRLAQKGNPAAIEFPRAMMHSGDYSFSLSGLKTAVINHIRHEQEAGRPIDIPDLAASFQQAVIDVQVAKAVRAVQEHGVSTFCLAGGVAANPALREALTKAMEERGVHVSVPPFEHCTDNAAMIALAGTFRFRHGDLLDLCAEAVPNLRLDTL